VGDFHLFSPLDFNRIKSFYYRIIVKKAQKFHFIRLGILETCAVSGITDLESNMVLVGKSSCVGCWVGSHPRNYRSVPGWRF
jgi:hypothetical protein